MRIRLLLIVVGVVALVALGTAVTAVGTDENAVNVELKRFERSTEGVVIFPMRAEFTDSFERSVIAPWTTYGDVIFGIRDTFDTYGPQAPAFSGYQYGAHPDTDLPEYPSPGSNPGNITYLESPTVDITGWDSLYLAFSYWGDFEGAATNFDGFIVEISDDNGSTWSQIDPSATGHLNPTYDSPLAGGSQLGSAWAYCYTTNPIWVTVASLDLITLGYAATGDQVKVRFTFAYDALAGGQGCFIDDVWLGDVEPPDLQPPVITHTPLIDTPDTLNPYTVSATITDDGSGVNSDSVVLEYQVEGGSMIEVSMAETSTDVYEADIPAQDYHTDIWYRIKAQDNSGNWSQTQLYNFEVTSAITLGWHDGQPYWITSGFAVGDGQFVQFDFSAAALDSGLLHQIKYYFDGEGNFDARIYSMSGGAPGALVDQVTGLSSPGYDWYTLDVTAMDIRMNDDPVIGYVVGTIVNNDTIQLLSDPTLDYANFMWIRQGGIWGNPISGGDYMINLKVIPLPEPGVEEFESEATASQLQLMPTAIRDIGTIRYQITTPQNIVLTVYDISGTKIKTLVDAHIQEGIHSVTWNGTDDQNRQVASGVYFVQLETETQTFTEKALIVR